MKKTVLTTILTLVMCTGALAQQSWAVVNVSANYLRSAPDYEASLETQALMGSVVEILGSQDYWDMVTLQEPGYTAWASDLCMTRMSEEELAEYIEAPKYICVSKLTEIYDRASFQGERVGELIWGDIVRMGFGDKGKPERSLGFNKVILPDGKEGYVAVKDLEGFASWAENHSTEGSRIVAAAKSFLGVPYLWGGNSVKGMDGSGLVWMSCFMNGLLMPRNASQQAELGEEVDMDALEPGDLLFFGSTNEAESDKISHVGIYVGDNNVIHASHYVQISSLSAADANYVGRKPLMARRLTDSSVRNVLQSPAFFKQ